MLSKSWYVFVGESWVGTLHPTGSDDEWIQADFEEGDAWGNFAPWFVKAAEAYQAGDEPGWQSWTLQLTAMGLSLRADDGESFSSPTIIIDGGQAWFAV
jgi:hypothetical protein